MPLLVLLVVVYTLTTRITRRVYGLVFRTLTVVIALLAALLLTAR